MTDFLYRDLAPIPPEAWAEIEEEAQRTLTSHLAGRRLVEVTGPLGWQASAVGTGRVKAIAEAPRDRVHAQQRLVQPLLEFRVPFTLSRAEIDAAGRGAKDADWQPVKTAAHAAALAEDGAIFEGYAAGGIAGIGQGEAHAALTITDDYTAYPLVVAEALNRLRLAGVDGPYAIALGPRCYTGLTVTTLAGYPVLGHVQRLVDGPIVWAPAVDGAIVLSLRGGDFELIVGQDFSIGYLGHTNETVDLYIQESFTFRVLAEEAAVPLRYASVAG